VDFSQVTAGIGYKIDIQLFDSKGRQKGKTQTITLGAAADEDVLIILFQTAIRDLDLTAAQVAGTRKVRITGAAADFKKVVYTTDSLNSQKGEKWVRNPDLKGPTVVGKPGAHAPTFIVNPKLF
jgi:hypothetical protein